MRNKKNLRSKKIATLFFTLSVFICIALITYHHSDPSLLNAYQGSVQNACGKVGASLSALLLSGFGFGAFLIPGIMILLGVSFYQQKQSLLLLTSMSIMLFCICTLLSLYLKSFYYAQSDFFIGGVLGRWIAQGLIHQLNPLGTGLVLLFIFLITSMYCIPMDVLELLNQLGQQAYLLLSRTIQWLLPLVRSLFKTQTKRKIRFPKQKELSPILLEKITPEVIIPTQPTEEVRFEFLQETSQDFCLPKKEFLKPPMASVTVDKYQNLQTSLLLVQKLENFGILGEITDITPGPVITLFEFKPHPNVKLSRISALEDDLAMALSAKSIRILAPLSGKAVVGFEFPNIKRQCVSFRECLEDADFFHALHTLPVVMGKNIYGKTIISDLAKMPHLLTAGQTGSGKSVFMNGLICSLLYKFAPSQLRFILIDPKLIEFQAYQNIPHLLLPVVDDPKQASTALNWAVNEMQRRYKILAKFECRNLAVFNEKILDIGPVAAREQILADANADELFLSFDDPLHISPLPFIVIVIDELADLMMTAKKEVEIYIARIAQKARAAGMHLITATQRPSTDVVTGLIKANLPTRVSFALASHIDSKTILDRAGAERLLGQGDMLFIPPGVSQLERLHAAYLSDEEIYKITDHLRQQKKAVYRQDILSTPLETSTTVSKEPLMSQAIEIIELKGQASASLLQRHLKIGYNRAATLIEKLEEEGWIGPADGSKPREILNREKIHKSL